jgi:hypothetical protein
MFPSMIFYPKRGHVLLWVLVRYQPQTFRLNSASLLPDWAADGLSTILHSQESSRKLNNSVYYQHIDTQSNNHTFCALDILHNLPCHLHLMQHETRDFVQITPIRGRGITNQPFRCPPKAVLSYVQSLATFSSTIRALPQIQHSAQYPTAYRHGN